MERLLGYLDPLPSSAARLALLRRLLAGAGLLLVALTWRLWTPQAVFPQVPLFRWAVHVPPALDWPLAAAMIGGLAGALVAPSRGSWARWSLLTFAAASCALVALDQQRLQPWMYQFILMAIILAVTPPAAASAWLKLLIISFYFHSALSKFDASFLHTLGPQFLAVLAKPFDALASVTPNQLATAALLFPAGELLVAIGLCVPATRVWAVGVALVLHALLLVILGPWGLDQRPAVLAWNAYFMIQDVLLFLPARGSPAVDSTQNLVPRAPWPVRAGIGAAVLLPLVQPTGWFDTWPSWALYAPSAERVVLYVHRRDAPRLIHLPEECLETPADASDPWLVVRLDRWALAALDAPIYPQNRYQLGVAEAIIARYQLSHRARLARMQLAARATGERAYDVLASMPAILAAEDEYWFNARPRAASFAPPSGTAD